MLMYKKLNKNISIIIVGITILVLTYSILYFIELYQLSDHESIVNKINNIKYYGVLDEYDPNVLQELVLTSKKYDINLLEVERTCGDRCSKYYEPTIEDYEWVPCSGKCTIRKLKDLIRTEAYGSISRVENWWNINYNLRSFRWKIQDGRDRIKSFFEEYQQSVKDYNEHQKQETLAEKDIPRFRKELEKVKLEAEMLGLKIDKAQILSHCKDEIEDTYYEDIDSFQAKRLLILCETTQYLYKMGKVK